MMKCAVVSGAATLQIKYNWWVDLLILDSSLGHFKDLFLCHLVGS